MSIRVEVQKNNIPALTGALRQELGKVVRETAFQIEAEAKQNAPVDTGFLRASIHTVTARGQGGQYRAAQEATGKITVDRQMLPEVENVTSELEAIVAVGAEYGPHVEFGTVDQAAQPFLTPAVEAARETFVQKVAEVLERWADRA